jgi:hypothetical protein
MLNRITRATPLSNYRHELEFEDGVYGTVDLSDRLFGEMFEPLRDEAMFTQVAIDEFGAVSWPNGADLAPDALHRTPIHRRFPVLVRSQDPPRPITGRTECLEQLLEAFADIADRDDVGRAANRLSRVHEWIKREVEQSAEKIDASDSQRARA